MVAVVVLATGVVVTVKLALVAPAPMFTDAGTLAMPLLLELSPTVAPPAGAPRFRFTVPLEEIPPNTAPGFMLTEATCGVGGVTTCGVPPPPPQLTNPPP